MTKITTLKAPEVMGEPIYFPDLAKMNWTKHAKANHLNHEQYNHFLESLDQTYGGDAHEDLRKTVERLSTTKGLTTALVTVGADGAYNDEGESIASFAIYGPGGNYSSHAEIALIKILLQDFFDNLYQAGVAHGRTLTDIHSDFSESIRELVGLLIHNSQSNRETVVRHPIAE